MKKIASFLSVLVGLFLVSTAPGLAAQAGDELAVPGYAVAVDVPDAHELPDPKIDYKIAWGIGQGPSCSSSSLNFSYFTRNRFIKNNFIYFWNV